MKAAHRTVQCGAQTHAEEPDCHGRVKADSDTVMTVPYRSPYVATVDREGRSLTERRRGRSWNGREERTDLDERCEGDVAGRDGVEREPCSREHWRFPQSSEPSGFPHPSETAPRRLSPLPMCVILARPSPRLFNALSSTRTLYFSSAHRLSFS